jgi:hypothetical protein
MLSRTASAIVAGLATLALAGCGSAEPPKPPPPPPPQPPEISVPAFSEDGGASCSKVSGLSNCVPWSQPEPENLPWEQIVAVRDQQVSGFAVGPAYLCGLVPDTLLRTLAGPHAVRVLDGTTCVLSSTDGPGWVTSAQGQVQGRVEFGDQAVTTPSTSIGGRPAAVDPPVDSADRTHRSGVITASDGTPLRVTLDITQVTADPARADDHWKKLAEQVAAATNR